MRLWQETTVKTHFNFMACPEGLLAFQYGAREIFLPGEGNRWWVPGRGKGKRFFLKGVSFKGVSFHFHWKSLFLLKRLISTAKVYFYGGGVFLRRRHISTAGMYFHGKGTFLRWRCVSTKKVCFYERGQFKSNRLTTCMEKMNQCTAQMNFYVETALF